MISNHNYFNKKVFPIFILSFFIFSCDDTVNEELSPNSINVCPLEN